MFYRNLFYERQRVYKNRASQGEIPTLTGIQDPFEPPIRAEVIIDTEHQMPEACVNNDVEEFKIHTVNI